MKSIPEVRNIFILFLFITFILGIFFCISSDPIGYFDIEKYKELFEKNVLDQIEIMGLMHI